MQDLKWKSVDGFKNLLTVSFDRLAINSPGIVSGVAVAFRAKLRRRAGELVRTCRGESKMDNCSSNDKDLQKERKEFSTYKAHLLFQTTSQK